MAINTKSKQGASPRRGRAVPDEFFTELVRFRDLTLQVAKLRPDQLRNGLAELETRPGELTRIVLEHSVLPANLHELTM